MAVFAEGDGDDGRVASVGGGAEGGDAGVLPEVVEEIEGLRIDDVADGFAVNALEQG